MRTANRRQRLRLAVPERLPGSVNLRTEVRVLNLSSDGAMIEHSERLFPGRTCTLFLQLPGNQVRLETQVVWSQVTRIQRDAPPEGGLRFRSGLHFGNLPEAAEAQLRDYLAMLSFESRKASQDVGRGPESASA